MAMRKRLMEGESLAVSGECVITAVRNCTIDIQADDSVAIGSLKWEVGAESGLLQATGSSGQAYIIYDNGASFYEYVDGLLTEHPIYKGDRPKAFCETHNLKWGKE